MDGEIRIKLIDAGFHEGGAGVVAFEQTHALMLDRLRAAKRVALVAAGRVNENGVLDGITVSYAISPDGDPGRERELTARALELVSDTILAQVRALRGEEP